MFLKKLKDPTAKQFDDDEWVTADVPESNVECECVSRRLLALNEGEIAALTLAMRQLGVGSQGGAEALVIFHQLLYDVWTAGSLNIPLVKNKCV